MKKTYSPMQFITQHSVIIVPFYPMAIVALAVFVFTLKTGLHWLLAVLLAAVAAVAIELAGISSFRTVVSVYQAFKRHRFNSFVVVEFTILLVGIVIYLSAIGLSAAVLDQEFPGAWPLGAMAGLLAIAVYVVRAVGETYQITELELEQDQEFERRQRDLELEQSIAEAEHRRLLERKQANIQTYEARTVLEQAKTTKPEHPKRPARTPARTTSNSPERSLTAPPGTSRTFRQAFGERQTEQNRIARSERLEQLLTLFSEQPNIGQNEAARTIGVAPSTCSDYVRQLRSAGRLTKNGHGWHVEEA